MQRSSAHRWINTQLSYTYYYYHIHAGTLGCMMFTDIFLEAIDSEIVSWKSLFNHKPLHKQSYKSTCIIIINYRNMHTTLRGKYNVAFYYNRKTFLYVFGTIFLYVTISESKPMAVQSMAISSNEGLIPIHLA